MHEYLVKWDGRSHEHNTWEPQTHLENVPQILETFEKQLARQKEQRAAIQAKQQAATLAAAVKVVDIGKRDVKDLTSTPSNVNPSTTQFNSSAGGQVSKVLSASNSSKESTESKLSLLSPAGSDSSKLSRNTKNKPVDPGKQWGSTDTDSEWGVNTSPSAGAKRKLNDSDFGDTASTPIAAITEEDLEEDLIPSHTVKRMKNGNTVSVKVETKNERNATIEVDDFSS